jgi:DNA polymerase alpha subunit A
MKQKPKDANLAGIEGDEDNQEEEEAQVPTGNAATKDAILPNVLRNLVQKRRMVKQQMKSEKDPVKYQQLNIRQTALKLTANSMYGCLGFGSSRFYALAIASLITRTGREILMKTKDIAEQKLGFSVIYGDTDSIMINTGTNKVQEAIQMGQKLKGEVNQLYKCLEIEIDGLFKSMLLLKKKKYAALVIENPGTKDEKITTELKGLDMVRRDWCPLSKAVGNYVLKEILSGKQREDVVMSLNEYLSNTGDKMKKGDINLSEYIITKQLTRPPSEYSDPKGLPHVQVAIRLKSQGKSDSDLVGNFIPYVICTVSNSKESKKTFIGDVSYSPDEYLKSQKTENKLVIDIDWYITQQLLPPITRLIEHIEGIEVDFVAQCLGVDGKKYKFNAHVRDENDGENAIANPIMKTETTEKLQGRSVASLKIQCPFCDESYDFPEIFHRDEEKDPKKQGPKLASNVCKKCTSIIPDQYIANRVQLFLKQLAAMYYRGSYTCREPSCG